MRVLVTGATGFVGGHLAEALLRPGKYQVFGMGRKSIWPVEWEHLQKSIPLTSVDWNSLASIEANLKAIQPDWIIHLAGYAHSGTSFREPDVAWAVNFTLTKSLLDAITQWGGKPRILYVSSGLVYGEPDFPNQPCNERTTLKPGSPYATSKCAADLLSYQYTRFPGLDIVRVRPFNHIGPKQSADYAAANFARQLAEIEIKGSPPIVETGDLSSQRDLTDVRDVVGAYIRLLEEGKTSEAYNVGSGTTYPMQMILDLLVRQSSVQIEVRQKIDPHRKAETTVTQADVQKIFQQTGWKPQIPLSQTLQDMLDDWRSRLKRGS
jgi:GDP-4-dehydro-6-deoxy-D-mannose reductase